MKQIENITDKASQVIHIDLTNGEPVDITLRYLPAIERWVIDIAHEQVNVTNIILANHPNLLWQFANTGSFGIACISSDNVDPFQYDDFYSGRCQLFMLEETDLANALDYVEGYPSI